MMQQLAQQQAADAIFERQLRIKLAWDAYENRLPKPLKVEKGKPDDNLLLGLAEVVVNKGVSFLFPEGISFEVDGQAKSDADTWLAACWEANRFMTTLLWLGINGGVCGDVFVKVKPASPFPRIIVLDPANVHVNTDEDDCQTEQEFVLQWNVVGSEKVKRETITNEGTPERPRWVIRQWISGPKDTWVQVGPDEVWPYEWAPIFHCQNLPYPNSYWGRSDLEAAVIDLNKSLNFTGTNIDRILRFHAHPKTVFTGTALGTPPPGPLNSQSPNTRGATPGVEVRPDGAIVLPNPNAKVTNLEMQGDLGSSREWFREKKQLFHEITRIPEVATGKVEDLGQLSGLALQILYQPLLEKTRDKRTLYGELLEKLGRCLLQLRQRGAKHVVKTLWPPVLPSDPKGDAETALLEEQLGVSRDTILTKLGYDPKDEAQKKAKERKSDQALGKGLLDEFDKGARPDDEPEEDEETEE